jgi:hypothetical protein
MIPLCLGTPAGVVIPRVEVEKSHHEVEAPTSTTTEVKILSLGLCASVVVFGPRNWTDTV